MRSCARSVQLVTSFFLNLVGKNADIDGHTSSCSSNWNYRYNSWRKLHACLTPVTLNCFLGGKDSSSCNSSKRNFLDSTFGHKFNQYFFEYFFDSFLQCFFLHFLVFFFKVVTHFLTDCLFCSFCHFLDFFLIKNTSF